MSKLHARKAPAMLKSLIEWFDRQLLARGAAATVRSIFAVLGFSVAVAAVPGVPTVKLAGLLLMILLALTFALVLLHDRAQLKQQADEDRFLLARYCRFLGERHGYVARVLSWRQTAVIDTEGGSKEVIRIHAVSMRRQLYFLPLKFGARWDQPKAVQKQVRVKVRSLLLEDRRGTSWRATINWLPDGRFELICHLRAPVKIGADIKLEIEWYWPGKCAPLVKRREPEEFIFKFNKLMPVEYAEYKITLPVGQEAFCEPIGFAEPSDSFEILCRDNPNESKTYTFMGIGLTPGRELGMRLEVKPRGSARMSKDD
ncbi:hypothetical protein [Amycolatopsis sp. NBRC 101858]|uniref:hypothetical protein n=1 Tax=Amycolatopsis sp. NBRC 101858 TaxID=3032200 RepID=UPI002552873C|nr:hypothetical protein [Amycolatopsis sp. NBRC 101858]